MDALDGCATIIPARVRSGLFDDHGSVGLEEQDVAVCGESEVNSTVVKIKDVVNGLKACHGPGAEEVRHVAQEDGLFFTMVRPVRHVGAEVVDLPVG